LKNTDLGAQTISEIKLDLKNAEIDDADAKAFMSDLAMKTPVDTGALKNSYYMVKEPRTLYICTPYANLVKILSSDHGTRNGGFVPKNTFLSDTLRKWENKWKIR